MYLDTDGRLDLRATSLIIITYATYHMPHAALKISVASSTQVGAFRGLQVVNCSELS